MGDEALHSYQVQRWWWVQLFERDIVDKKGSYRHSIHDNIVRWIFGEKEVV